MNITEQQKKDIFKKLRAEKERLGSYSQVARQLNMAKGSVQNLCNPERLHYITDRVWQKALQGLNGGGLAHDPDNPQWQLCRETTDYQLLTTALDDARAHRLWFIVSYSAGSGKSAILKNYKYQHRDHHVFLLNCREWQAHEFARRLCDLLGIKLRNRAHLFSCQLMLDRIVGRLQRLRSPMLILDEADKLSPEALRMLIPLYNELEEHASVVLSGTEHLKKHMRKGVIYRKKGYDELESRFGRSYFSLLGATKEDVRKIAEANGYKGDIAPLWEACEHHRAVLDDGRSVPVVADLRRLKRLIQKAKLMDGTSV